MWHKISLNVSSYMHTNEQTKNSIFSGRKRTHNEPFSVSATEKCNHVGISRTLNYRQISPIQSKRPRNDGWIQPKILISLILFYLLDMAKNMHLRWSLKLLNNKRDPVFRIYLPLYEGKYDSVFTYNCVLTRVCEYKDKSCLVGKACATKPSVQPPTLHF